MDYIIDADATIKAICEMGLAITAGCPDDAICDECPVEHRCAFLIATMKELEKGEEKE